MRVQAVARASGSTQRPEMPHSLVGVQGEVTWRYLIIASNSNIKALFLPWTSPSLESVSPQRLLSVLTWRRPCRLQRVPLFGTLARQPACMSRKRA